MGEGGAVVSDDEAFMDRCQAYHDFGGEKIRGTKIRLSEYQAAIGLAQLVRLEEQTEKRNANADYLRAKMKEIPGIFPNRLYPQVTKGAYHHFPFRFRKEEFAGMTRAQFVKALNAEGIPCGTGYDAGLNTGAYINDYLKSKNFRKMYTADELDWNKFLARNQCPVHDRLCNEETVEFSQKLLLADRIDMDDIIKAIGKIHATAGKIRKDA
jgi:dTDP-4-amino-4,6-dideoxygalactose transaminase